MFVDGTRHFWPSAQGPQETAERRNFKVSARAPGLFCLPSADFVLSDTTEPKYCLTRRDCLTGPQTVRQALRKN